MTRAEKWGMGVGVPAALLTVLVPLGVWGEEAPKGKFESRVGELVKQGVKVRMAELAPAEVPEKENAALLIEEAFIEIGELADATLVRLGELAAKGKPPAGDDLKDARRILREGHEALELVREGVEWPRCRYTINYTAPAYSIQLPHLSKLRTAARLLQLSSAVHLADGDADAAVADCVCMLRLAQTLREEPILVSMLVKFAVGGAALKQLERVLDAGSPSADALRKVLVALDGVDERAQFVLAMEGERCMGVEIVRAAMKEPEQVMQLLTQGEARGDRVYTEEERAAFRQAADPDGVTYLEMIGRYIELARRTRREAAEEWRTFEKDVEKTRGDGKAHPMTSLLLPALQNVSAVTERQEALWRSARLAVALRLFKIRNAKYPDALAALTPDFLKNLPPDPFTGKAFIYRTEGDGFVIYSVGENGVDEGGVEDPKDRAAGDIVWKCSR